jgi:HEAT repeat protein
MLRSDDQHDVQRAINDLQRLPVLEAIRLLQNLSLESKTGLRCRALIGMLSISPEGAERLAIHLLEDPAGAVRWYACDTLGTLGHPRSIPLIARLLEADPDALVRHLAAYWLGELADESALPLLIAAAERDTGTDHEGRSMRDTATKAIRKIRAHFAGGNKRLEPE